MHCILNLICPSLLLMAYFVSKRNLTFSSELKYFCQEHKSLRSSFEIGFNLGSLLIIFTLDTKKEIFIVLVFRSLRSYAFIVV